MSTIRVNAIQNTSGVEQYLARAWVNFNGTGTVAIRASGNVSSITDNGVGDYTVNFTNAMADASYAVLGTSSSDSTANPLILANFNRTSNVTSAPTVSSCRVSNINAANGAATDQAYVAISIYR